MTGVETDVPSTSDHDYRRVPHSKAIAYVVAIVWLVAAFLAESAEWKATDLIISSVWQAAALLHNDGKREGS